MSEPTFESFVEVQLGDQELNALELDLNWRLSFLLGLTDALLHRAIAGERVDPELWPELRSRLNVSIAQLEHLREVYNHG